MDLNAANREPVRELPPTVFSAWTVASVRAALASHEAGDFSQSAILADHIWRDDRFYSTLQTRVLAVLGLPFNVDASESTKNTPRAESLQKRVREWWFDAMPEAVLGDVLRCVIPMGFAIGENVWHDEPESGELRIKQHKIHNLEFVRWRDDLQKFVIVGRDGKETQVNPGDGRWVLWTASASDRPWMSGAIRALAIPFLLRTFTRRDWARRGEVEGLGVRKAGVPDDPKEENIRQFFSDVRNLGAETTLKLPPGYTFEIEATDASAADGFNKLIAHCDTAITLTILGQNLTTQIEGGSFAAASVHSKVQLDRTESDVAMLATVARGQIVIPWGYYNVPGFKSSWAPWPRYDSTPAEDIQKVAQGFLTLAQAAKGLRELGVDISGLVERFGLMFAKPSTADGKTPAGDTQKPASDTAPPVDATQQP